MVDPSCQIEGCGLPVEAEHSSFSYGVDYDGTDAVFSIVKVRCPAGHWYHEIDEVVRDPTEEE